jgi:hypothetical protein
MVTWPWAISMHGGHDRGCQSCQGRVDTTVKSRMLVSVEVETNVIGVIGPVHFA